MALAQPLSVLLACATICPDARPDFGMPQMGCGRLCRRLCPDEIVRGQSNSRRHPEASVQNTADQARHARVIDVRSNAFRVGVAARAETGLILPDAWQAKIGVATYPM